MTFSESMRKGSVQKSNVKITQLEVKGKNIELLQSGDDTLYR